MPRNCSCSYGTRNESVLASRVHHKGDRCPGMPGGLSSVRPPSGGELVDGQSVLFGEQAIDLSAVEQLVDPSQTRALAAALYYAREKYMDGQQSLAQVLHQVMQDIERVRRAWEERKLGREKKEEEGRRDGTTV